MSDGGARISGLSASRSQELLHQQKWRHDRELKKNPSLILDKSFPAKQPERLGRKFGNNPFSNEVRQT